MLSLIFLPASAACTQRIQSWLFKCIEREKWVILFVQPLRQFVHTTQIFINNTFQSLSYFHSNQLHMHVNTYVYIHIYEFLQFWFLMKISKKVCKTKLLADIEYKFISLKERNLMAILERKETGSYKPIFFFIYTANYRAFVSLAIVRLNPFQCLKTGNWRSAKLWLIEMNLSFLNFLLYTNWKWYFQYFLFPCRNCIRSAHETIWYIQLKLFCVKHVVYHFSKVMTQHLLFGSLFCLIVIFPLKFWSMCLVC